MTALEISGKTVEEAIQHALEQLGVSREEVEVTVVKEGRGGIMGLGAEDAVVRVKTLVTLPEEEKETAGVAGEVLEKLLALMGVDGSIVPQSSTAMDEGEEALASIAFNIEGDDLGILIGRRGQTLSCLQYIVRLIVGHQTANHLPIVVDVAGYKQRRNQALRLLARNIAEQVAARGRQFTLEPMPPYERRIIHLALANHPDVITQSIGEGDVRKVVIMPREQ